MSSRLICSNSPLLLAVWGKFIPEGSRRGILSQILSPINCSVPPASHHNNNMTHRHNQASASHSISGLIVSPHRSSYLKLWTMLSISAPSFLCPTQRTWLEPTNWFSAVYLLETHGHLCFWTLFLSLIAHHSRPEVSGSAGSSANTQSARDDREDTEVVLRCSHTGRSQFQELNWLPVHLWNGCWTICSLQNVPWSNSLSFDGQF